MGQIGDIVKGIVGSDQVTLIMKAVMLLLMGIGWFIFRRWLSGAKIDEARDAELKKELEDIMNLESKNRESNEEAKLDSHKIDEFLK
jgi:sulfite exporter TauE/SafE